METHCTCLRCGRKISDKKSRERGYGPTCWKKSQQDPDLIDLLNHPEHAIANEQNFVDEIREQIPVQSA